MAASVVGGKAAVFMHVILSHLATFMQHLCAATAREWNDPAEGRAAYRQRVAGRDRFDIMHLWGRGKTGQHELMRSK
jgi:hypothetical protein